MSVGDRRRAARAAGGDVQPAPTGKVTARRRLHRAQPRRRPAPAARTSPPSAVPTDGGAITRPGPVPGLRGQAAAVRTTRAATASRTPRPARPGRRTTTTAPSSPPTASGWPRAGRSTSACATSPGVLTDPAISGPFLRHPGVELRLRDRRRSGSPSCSGLLCALALQLAAGCAASSLYRVAADPAVRHAVVRDAAGLAGHVQHRLRPDQPAVRARRRLVRAARGRPGSR